MRAHIYTLAHAHRAEKKEKEKKKKTLTGQREWQNGWRIIMNHEMIMWTWNKEGSWRKWDLRHKRDCPSSNFIYLFFHLSEEKMCMELIMPSGEDRKISF